jgi:bifunctional DNA-binding transcriptional regulator/antitoxin component of YhaV-PrlF toxin-antitoxin module
MKTVRISKGGQVSVPAEIRHRWKTSVVELDDRGDELVLRPAPEDPIAALRGALADVEGPSTDEIRAQLRDEEREREER